MAKIHEFNGESGSGNSTKTLKLATEFLDSGLRHGSDFHILTAGNFTIEEFDKLNGSCEHIIIDGQQDIV